MKIISDHKPIQVVVNKSLADEFASIVIKRLHESEHKVHLAQLRLSEAQRALELAMDEHLVNTGNYHALTSGSQLLDNAEIINSGDRNLRIETRVPESNSSYRIQNKFWREQGFPGWREYTKSVLDNSREFLSLSDFLDGMGESNQEERKRLESSISNALTTLHQRGEVGAIQILGERGRYYGSALIFEKAQPKPESLKSLQKRLRLNFDQFNVQEIYPPNGR
ncbi:hypothetical protein FEM33_06615 [Dyadobacter flavalbus]|uniref:Uncharacterized protein n=1 Tax=Dyadobacter flavalbus TaxID=2579942 RepID=A0A5M8R0R8_9BACT|nr:hypothetical protein [Dyadobacter flavalbus]KAA6440273.1 hypothetical protein FEM33_06615 [Dyadobacter flavalbus]